MSLTNLRAIETAPATELSPPIPHLVTNVRCARGNSITGLADGTWFWHANGRRGHTAWFAEGREQSREEALEAARDAIRRMR